MLSNREVKEYDTDLDSVYTFTDESILESKRNSLNWAIDNASAELDKYVKSWLMDVTQKNTAEIQFAWVMQKRIDTTWQYLWNPMAYYEKVKEKHNAWEQLTDWEKKILENWKYLYNLADDFSSFLAVFSLLLLNCKF